MSRIEIAGLYEYPIKSCAGVEKDELTFGENGKLQFDRHWMIVDTSGIFVSQRKYSKMALIKPTMTNGVLIIEALGEPSKLFIPLDYHEGNQNVSLWNHNYEAIHDGALASEWFSDYLGVKEKIHLVHLSENVDRQKHGSRFGFADSSPLLIVSQESLNDLNERIKNNGHEPVTINRFRPNIVLSGCVPYQEDSMQLIRVGDGEILVYDKKIRCAMVQINQLNGVKGKEPLYTLMGYRRVSPKEVAFGQKAAYSGTGTIYKKDQVVVVSNKQEFVV